MQGLLQFAQYADKIDDEADLLLNAFLIDIWPVHTGDSLKQNVIPHRLVEIEAVEQRRVIAGEELVGNDQDFRVLVGLLKQQADIFLTFVTELQLGDQRPIHHVGGVFSIDGLGPFRRQQLVERLLVFGAGLAIDRDHKRLVAERQHVFLEVLGDERGHLCDAIIRLQEGAQAHRAIQYLVQLFDIRHALSGGEFEEFLVQPVNRDRHLAWRQDVLDRQCGFVGDGLP